MVVQPIGLAVANDGSLRRAWDAVELRQRGEAPSYLLIAQPEHARLAGELAAHFISPLFPTLSKQAIEAISAHDEGWSQMPGESAADPRPLLTASGKPRSFIEFPPAEF